MRVKTNITQAHLDEINKYAATVARSFNMPVDVLQAAAVEVAAEVAKGMSADGSWLVPNLDEFKKLTMHLVKSRAEMVTRREALSVSLPFLRKRPGMSDSDYQDALDAGRAEAADMSLRSFSLNDEANDLAADLDPFEASEAAIEASRIFDQAGVSGVEADLFRLVAADRYTVPEAAKKLSVSVPTAYRMMNRTKTALASVTKGMVR